MVPNVNVFRSDNRSSYNALMLHLQGNVSRRLNLVANYTFSKAQTWGCVLLSAVVIVKGRALSAWVNVVISIPPGA